MSELQKPTKFESKEDRRSAVSSVNDLVKVAKDGSGRRPDAKFLSDHELRHIEANKDMIRDMAPDSRRSDLTPEFRQPVFDELAKGIDDLEGNDKKHDGELGALNERISRLEDMLATQTSDNAELKHTIRDLIEKLDSKRLEDDESDVAVDEEEKEKTKEVELWKGEDDADEKDSATFEIADELKEALDAATDKYAELTAKHRNGHFGHLLRKSKYIAKIPGAKWLAERANDVTDIRIEAARENYAQAVQHIQGEIDRQMKYENASIEDIRNEAAKFGLQHEAVFEAKAVEARTSRSKKTNKFVEWWVKQEGWKGKAKKALVVGAAGITAGFTAGLAVPILGAGLVGGATGGAIAKHVTNRRANTTGGGEATLAQRQSEEDMQRKKQYHDEQLTSDQFVKTGVSPEGFLNITEDRTADEKMGNRRRMKSAIAVGAAAGGIGGRVADLFHSPDTASAKSAVDSTSKQPADRTQVPLQKPDSPDFVGNNFLVEPGNGYTHELIDFAQSNGHNLNPQQAWQLHEHLVGQFGNDYIDIAKHATDTYMQNGDARLIAPGNASWDPGVGEAVKQWMTSKEIW